MPNTFRPHRRTRADRRNADTAAKAAARALARRQNGAEPDARTVGRLASTHGRPCSCHMCRRGPSPDRAPVARLDD